MPIERVPHYSPPIHVLVCVNARPSTDPMPCCAKADGQRLYEQLCALVQNRGWHGQVVVTRTLCLGWCHVAGSTIAIHPGGIWLRRCAPTDAETILDQFVAPSLGRVDTSELKRF